MFKTFFFISIHVYLPMILIDGAHNSMADIRSSPRTQWYWKDLQFLAPPANDEQFFLLAAASKEDRFAGHLVIFVIVFRDAIQGSVNASGKPICKKRRLWVSNAIKDRTFHIKQYEGSFLI